MSNEQLFDARASALGRGISMSEASVPGRFEEWCGQTEMRHRELGREKDLWAGRGENSSLECLARAPPRGWSARGGPYLAEAEVQGRAGSFCGVQGLYRVHATLPEVSSQGSELRLVSGANYYCEQFLVT